MTSPWLHRGLPYGAQALVARGTAPNPALAPHLALLWSAETPDFNLISGKAVTVGATAEWLAGPTGLGVCGTTAGTYSITSDSLSALNARGYAVVVVGWYADFGTSASNETFDILDSPTSGQPSFRLRRFSSVPGWGAYNGYAGQQAELRGLQYAPVTAIIGKSQSGIYAAYSTGPGIAEVRTSYTDGSLQGQTAGAGTWKWGTRGATVAQKFAISTVAIFPRHSVDQVQVLLAGMGGPAALFASGARRIFVPVASTAPPSSFIASWARRPARTIGAGVI